MLSQHTEADFFLFFKMLQDRKSHKLVKISEIFNTT